MSFHSTKGVFGEGKCFIQGFCFLIFSKVSIIVVMLLLTYTKKLFFCCFIAQNGYYFFEMYFYKKLLLLLCWMTISMAVSTAQELSSQVYGINSPLHSNTINEIHYSKDGLLYIAAQSGFFAFNGHTFREFKLSNGTSFNATNIEEDTDGTIYLISSFEQSLHRLYQNQIQKVVLPDSIKGQKLNRFIIQDSFMYYFLSNTIWATDRSKDSTYVILKNNTITTANIAKNCAMGIQYADIGVLLQQLEEGQLITRRNHTPITHFHRALDTAIVDYIPREKENGYIIDVDGHILIDLQQCSIPLTPSGIKKINNQFWVLCQQGLYIPYLNKLYFEGQFITGVVQDSENSIWVATLDAGLHKVDLDYVYYPIVQEGRSAHFIFVHEDRLLYSDRKGNLYTWDTIQGSFFLFDESKLKATVKNIFYNPVDDCFGVSGNEYRTFDRKTLQQIDYREFYGKCRFDSIAHYVEHTVFKSMYRRLHPRFVEAGRKVFELKKVSPIDKAHDVSFFNNGHLTNDKISFSEVVIFSNEKKYNDPIPWEGMVVGSCDSLLVFVDFERKEIISTSEHNNIKNYYVSNNRLFLFTDSYIHEISKSNTVIRSVKRKNGTEQMVTNVSANEDYIAISTIGCVYLLDASSLQTIYKFSSKNGIASKDGNRAWIYQDYLYVNGSQGVTKINLSTRLDKGTPSVAIESIWNNQSLITTTDLDYTQNDLKFLFSIRSMKIAGQLYWRLNNEDWSATNEEEILLQNLQYGTYTIEVYYKNDLGVSSPLVSHTFTIHPPYWQTWWFQLSLYFLGLLILLGIGWWIIRNNQKRLKRESKFNQLKLQALQSQMNPHFIFNVLTAVQNLWLQGKNEAAMKLQSNFAKLLRKIFQYSSQQNITIEQLSDFINNYLKLEQIRFDHKVDIDFEIDGVLYEEDYGVPPLLLQPVIENSFKHGLLHKNGEKKLSIKLTIEGDYLYAVVEDNGVGRTISETSDQTRNSGLKTTFQRLNILQESKIGTPHPHQNIRITDLKNQSNLAIGTKVEIWIPLTFFQVEKL